MQKLTLADQTETFEVTVLESTSRNGGTVLFAVGSGGNPERHLPLLGTLAESGYTVVAPHFDRLSSPNPNEDELLLRARRLTLGLNAVALPGSSVAGVGHSIGAACLLALAGGQMWSRAGQVDIEPDERLTRLVLLAPPTGFFQVNGALDTIKTPILAWAGSEDTITPPSQVNMLAHGMRGDVTADVRVTDGAGHFSFMDLPPPHSVEPLPDRQAFLDELAREIASFLGS